MMMRKTLFFIGSFHLRFSSWLLAIGWLVSGASWAESKASIFDVETNLMCMIYVFTSYPSESISWKVIMLLYPCIMATWANRWHQIAIHNYRVVGPQGCNQGPTLPAPEKAHMGQQKKADPCLEKEGNVLAAMGLAALTATNPTCWSTQPKQHCLIYTKVRVSS